MDELVFFSTLALVMGVVLDAILGDPKGWPHLIKWFGKVIAYLKRSCILWQQAPVRQAPGSVLLLSAGVPHPDVGCFWRHRPGFSALESLPAGSCWHLKACGTSMPVYDALKIRM